MSITNLLQLTIQAEYSTSPQKMSHIIEPAASGRAKCRGCKQAISKGELRFGERLPNPFADGEMTLWFHLDCGAYRRPESFNEVLAESESPPEDAPRLKEIVAEGLMHDRLPRIAGAGVAPSARAKCRECREPILKDHFRIALEFFEEGMFNPAGFIHPECASKYFETTDILDRVRRFTTELDDQSIAKLGKTIA